MHPYWLLLSNAITFHRSTIGQAYVWPGSRLLKKVYCLAIDINIVGIFKAQKGTVSGLRVVLTCGVLRLIRCQATTEDDSEEGTYYVQYCFYWPKL